MNQLSTEGFMFYMFWGCVLLVVASVACAVWDWVAERRARSRFWAGLRARTWEQREWGDHEEASDGSV